MYLERFASLIVWGAMGALLPPETLPDRGRVSKLFSADEKLPNREENAVLAGLGRSVTLLGIPSLIASARYGAVSNENWIQFRVMELAFELLLRVGVTVGYARLMDIKAGPRQAIRLWAISVIAARLLCYASQSELTPYLYPEWTGTLPPGQIR